MENYRSVMQWLATVNVDAAVKEIEMLKLKYPWLKCDETIATLKKMQNDLPQIVNIIKLQEKQNAMHREYIRVNGLADTAIVEAIKLHYNL